MTGQYQSINQVPSFLGLCSQYDRYIWDFATIEHPLYHLTEETCEFNWDDSAKADCYCQRLEKRDFVVVRHQSLQPQDTLRQEQMDDINIGPILWTKEADKWSIWKGNLQGVVGIEDPLGALPIKKKKKVAC